MSVENRSTFHRLVRLCWSYADNIISIAVAILAAYVSAFGGKTDLAIAATATVLGILAFGAIRDRAARDELKRNAMTLQRLVEAQRQSVSPDRFFTRASSDCAALAGAESHLLGLQETARLIGVTYRQDILSLLPRGGQVLCICALDSPGVARVFAL